MTLKKITIHTVTNREVFGIRSSIPRSSDSKAELKKQMVRLVSQVIVFPLVFASLMSFANLFALNAAPSNQMEIWSALSCLTVKCSLSAALHQDFHSVWSDMEPRADWDNP